MSNCPSTRPATWWWTWGTAGGPLPTTLLTSTIYQTINGETVEVAGRFVLLDGWTYSFEVTGDYDPAHTLIIDPDLTWSTSLGGSAWDWGNGIAVDGSGNVFVTGFTRSSDFSGKNNSHKGNYDAFVAKIAVANIVDNKPTRRIEATEHLLWADKQRERPVRDCSGLCSAVDHAWRRGTDVLGPLSVPGDLQIWDDAEVRVF